jgi:hypothetical protein
VVAAPLKIYVLTSHETVFTNGIIHMMLEKENTKHTNGEGGREGGRERERETREEGIRNAKMEKLCPFFHTPSGHIVGVHIAAFYSVQARIFFQVSHLPLFYRYFPISTERKRSFPSFKPRIPRPVASTTCVFSSSSSPPSPVFFVVSSAL